MSEMLMEDYIREQINKGQYGVIVIPISTAEDIAYYIETSRDKTEPVRHGKWIEDDIDKWRCSVCQKGDAFAFSWSISEGYELQDSYCPHCGAKMNNT